MHEADAPDVIANIHREPDLLDRQTDPIRERVPFRSHQRDDLVDHHLPEVNHLQPLEGRHPTYGAPAAWGEVLASAGVEVAEGGVATEDEDAGGFGGVGESVVHDDGGEAGVDEEVEALRNGVEGEEGVDGEVLGVFDGQLGVGEEGGEDVEGGCSWRWWDGGDWWLRWVGGLQAEALEGRGGRGKVDRWIRFRGGAGMSALVTGAGLGDGGYVW